MFGSIFENLVVADRLKRHLNHGEVPELFFYRDDSKIEVDLCDMTDHSAPELIEVKSSATYHHDYARHLGKVGELLGIPSEMRSVVLRVDKSYVSQGVKVRSIIDELSQ